MKDVKVNIYLNSYLAFSIFSFFSLVTWGVICFLSLSWFDIFEIENSFGVGVQIVVCFFAGLPGLVYLHTPEFRKLYIEPSASK